VIRQEEDASATRQCVPERGSGSLEDSIDGTSQGGGLVCWWAAVS